MPRKKIPEPWKSFLAELDDAASGEVVFHCIGGFTMTQLYGLPRATADVDVLSITPNDQRKTLLEQARQGSLLHQKHGVYLDLVTMAAVPEDYEERLTEMFPKAFKRLRVFALDPYDLALTKLERNIQRDRDDVKHLARTLPLDLNLLWQRYQQELRPNLGNPTREDLTLQLWIEAIEEERAGS